MRPQHGARPSVFEPWIARRFGRAKVGPFRLRFNAAALSPACKAGPSPNAKFQAGLKTGAYIYLPELIISWCGKNRRAQKQAPCVTGIRRDGKGALSKVLVALGAVLVFFV